MDYLRMAERAGMDMSQEAVRWPKTCAPPMIVQ